MERIPRGRFTREFKEEAVKMVTEDGLTIPEVGRRLSVFKSTLGYWMQIAKEGRLSCLPQSRRMKPFQQPTPEGREGLKCHRRSL
jgi:transposase